MQFGWFAGGLSLMWNHLFTCQSCRGSLPGSVPGNEKTQHTAFSHWLHMNADLKVCHSYCKWPFSCHTILGLLEYIYFILDMFLAGWWSQMSAPLRWLEGAGTIWAVSGRESFQQHLTLRLTHNFIVPMNVLMRQNVFDRKNPGRHLWIIH